MTVIWSIVIDSCNANGLEMKLEAHIIEMKDTFQHTSSFKGHEIILLAH